MRIYTDLYKKKPTFTRASVATDAEGNQVAANLPRFTADGLMVEEGTTNLIPSASAPSMSSAVTVTVTSGTTYTVSCATGTITLSGAGTGTVTNGNPVTITASSTSLTLTPTGTATNVQLEKKSYATSYINGTRAAEGLTVPASVFTKDEGTLEFTITPKVIANYNSYFQFYGSWGRFVILFTSDGRAYCDYGNGTNNGGDMYIGTVTANTSLKISFSWSASSGKRIAVVNGVSYTSAGWSVPNGLTFPSTISPVSNFSSDIQNIRFSNTAHSADKMIVDQQLGRLQVESDTTYYLPLDGDMRYLTYLF